jgi:hypothetical protein
MRLFCAVLIAALVFAAPAARIAETPEVQGALNHISADSLRGHLSFIASDLLEGRDTPSPGLNIAAEYIAAQFRRSGLEAPVNGDYFQEADFVQIIPGPDAVEFTMRDADKGITAGKDNLSLQAFRAVDVRDAGVFKIRDGEVDTAQLSGKMVFAEMPSFRDAGASEKMNRLQKLPAAAIVLFSKSRNIRRAGASGRLTEAERVPSPGAPLLIVNDPEALKLFEALPPGPAELTATLRAAAPEIKPVKLRNVIGLLRGSDPALKDTYILLTAHYDHLGMLPDGPGDRIYNGANDDGSGTVSVVEIAGALATLNPHPKRSVVFIAFFGEEKGLLGSRYYGHHAVFPLAKTIAQVNLEQLGRTDDTAGPEVAAAAFTGADFSDVPAVFRAAGEATGIKIYSSPNSDAYFARSDNQALADLGVPAHTIGVAFEFPDYHQVSDEWPKIDFANMTKVDRMIALGVVMLADSTDAPHWNKANPKTEKYVRAQEALAGASK